MGQCDVPSTKSHEVRTVSNVRSFYLLLLTSYCEQISYFCKNGTKGMWLAKTADGKLQQITTEWVTQGIQVFQGDFTCCNRKHEGMACCDKEKLVAPILGLLGAAYELRTVHPEIYSLLDQPNMFPEMFTLEKKTESGKVVKQVKPLFGDRVGFMKGYIDHDPAGAAHRQLVKANAKKVSSDRKADRKARQSRVPGGPGKRVPGSTVPTMERTGLANFRGFGRACGRGSERGSERGSSRSTDVVPNEAQRRSSGLAKFRGLGRRSWCGVSPSPQT